jgi:hypothetical protein
MNGKPVPRGECAISASRRNIPNLGASDVAQQGRASRRGREIFLFWGKQGRQPLSEVASGIFPLLPVGPSAI